jgi:acetyl-CoA synthetase
LLIYTSGTTGDPKGVLHGHRVALGHANFSYVLDIVRPGDSYYAPNDWSWIAGAGNGLLAPWGFGIPVLSMGDSRFEASDVTAFLDRHRPTLAFLPPSALRILRQAEASLDHKLRCLMSGGEVVTPELANWVTENLADSLNVGFGQTEGNDTIGTVHAWEEAPPGTIGQALPGHTVGVLDQNGNEVEVGEEGELALRYESNPTFMLGYFHNPAATAHAIRDGWIWTGDRVMRGDRGYLIFAGRADDVIKSSGYRIGPSEIERVLARHPAVLECAVVGLPDPERGEAITAVVRLRPGTSEERLREELTLAVRREVGHHAYPRRIEFVDELPKTVTGKVQRRALRAALLD